MKGFTSKDGRTIDKGQKVAVHWNSHKGNYSILALEGPNKGKVIGYTQNIQLERCGFKIERSKQRKVQESGVKDRHAYVTGHVTSLEAETLTRGLYYNPHKLESFVDTAEYFKDTKNPKYLTAVTIVSMETRDEKPLVTYK